VQSEKPADVVHAGAACLAQMLGGFAWVRSRQLLERQTAGRREAMKLGKGKYNRSGQLIQLDVENLAVFDDELGGWRRANPKLTVDPRHVASAVPDALLTPWGFAQDLMEFLVSSGHDAEAHALWVRVRELNPNHQHALVAGQEMAPSGDRPRWHTAEAIGWSAAVLGLL
jgi:hypothetical protein